MVVRSERRVCTVSNDGGDDDDDAAVVMTDRIRLLLANCSLSIP